MEEVIPELRNKIKLAVTAIQLDINLRLINCEKVNEQGTLITLLQQPT